MNGTNQYTHISINTHTHMRTHISINTHTQIQFLIREVASEVNGKGSTVEKESFQFCLKRWKG